MTLTKVRKELKAIGYNVKTKSLSWGKHATYFRISDKQELPSIFTSDTLADWQPLLSWLETNKERLQELAKREEIRGLAK